MTVPSYPTPISTAQCSPTRKHQRKTQPHRSLQKPKSKEERLDHGIIQLDVFSLYLSDPKRLLSQRQCRPKTPKMAIFRGQKAVFEPAADYHVDLSHYRNTTGASLVQWKGAPLDFNPSVEGYAQLTPEEIQTCRILRLSPAQYLHIKATMLKAVMKGPFKKRDAQGWFRIDVNKTNKLYDWFYHLGWIPTIENWQEHVRQMSQMSIPLITPPDTSSHASPNAN